MNVTSPPSPHRPPSGLPAELVESTAFLLKRLGHLARDRALGEYESTGLGPYHHGILALLDEGSTETQGAIADSLGYDRGQLVGLLDELEERRLVERHRDPNDRRRHLVRLTDEGRRTLDGLRALARRLEDELLAPLDEAQRAQLHALLLALAREHLPQCRPAG